MARLLLVDDEVMATRTMQTLVLERMPELDVFCANSAQGAMELLQRIPFEVVVTDVCMPQMSGIELLDAIKRLWPACYVIILTAYDNFEYAYRTVRYDNVKFILKIEPAQLILDVIQGAFEKIERDLSAQENDDRMQSYLQEMCPSFRKAVLDRFFKFGGLWPSEAEQKQCSLETQPEQDTMLVMTGGIDAESDLHEVAYVVERIFRQRGLGIDSYFNDEHVLFIIQKDEGAQEDEIMDFIRGQLDQLIENRTHDRDGKLSFALLPGFVPWRRVKSMAEALEQYVSRQVEPSQVATLSNADAFMRSGPTIGQAERWRDFILRGEIRAVVDDMAEYLKSGSFQTCRMHVGMLLQIILQEQFDIRGLEEVEIGGRGAEEILLRRAYSDASEWLRAVEALLDEMLRRGESRSLSEREALVERIDRYIERNLGLSLTLSSIAEHFSYNSSYLSRIYKSAAGEGINEHIARVRIEEACRRLRQSDESINVIAETCGFQTAKYFSTTFKKLVGTTPSAWRESE